MKNIYVTKPFLPPLNDFIKRLEEVWDSGILTNCGPQHQHLEAELKKYLGVHNMTLVNNGTMALLAALEILNVRGEVITTPYSFVATSHCLIWKKCKPVFVDINSEDCNIDPSKILEAINERTTAILAVHCYGFPCDVDELQNIANRNNLRLIYDAAHAFGVRYNNRSILDYGDASVVSFHATKIFNTVEGGALVFSQGENSAAAKKIRNFGFDNEISVSSVGLNFKMNEIQAIMGLAQLGCMSEIRKKRAAIAQKYDQELSVIKGLKFPRPRAGATSNYSYYPILVESCESRSRDGLYDFLKKSGIHSRRYFYPLISDFMAYKGADIAIHHDLPIARSISERILCLPIYPDLLDSEQSFVIKKVKKFIEG